MNPAVPYRRLSDDGESAISLQASRHTAWVHMHVDDLRACSCRAILWYICNA